MTAPVKNLNEVARELLASGKVELVIGYARGRDGLSVTPAIVKDATDADRLIFDRSCEINLANYLPRYGGKKIAIVVKGCDERSVIGLIQERQAKRESIVIVGAPCRGIVDRKRMMRAAGGAEITEPRVGDSTVRFKAGGKDIEIKIEEVVYAGCLECPVHNPRFADVLISEPVEQPAVPGISPEVAETEAEPIDARWAKFQREMGKCILCLACRNLCPACYCKECFVDSTQPRWTGKTDDEADVMFYQMTRLMHLAGRCTGCGACVRGCPMEVNLRIYNDKLRKESKEQFEFEAGMDLAAKPPLTCFKPDDKNDFVM